MWLVYGSSYSSIQLIYVLMDETVLFVRNKLYIQIRAIFSVTLKSAILYNGNVQKYIQSIFQFKLFIKIRPHLQSLLITCLNRLSFINDLSHKYYIYQSFTYDFNTNLTVDFSSSLKTVTLWCVCDLYLNVWFFGSMIDWNT